MEDWLEAQRIKGGSHGFECIGIARMQQVWDAAREELEQQLTEREKQITLLRGYLEQLACLGNGDQHGNSVGNVLAIEALDAIDKDLSGCIICDAAPVAKWKEAGWSDIPDGEPLYKARKP